MEGASRPHRGSLLIAGAVPGHDRVLSLSARRGLLDYLITIYTAIRAFCIQVAAVKAPLVFIKFTRGPTGDMQGQT